MNSEFASRLFFLTSVLLGTLKVTGGIGTSEQEKQLLFWAV
jgi:hypothetical protein